MQNDLPELKPCPFCGSKAVVDKFKAGGVYQTSVRCTGCNLSVTNADYKACAISRWNTRGPSDAARGELPWDIAAQGLLAAKCPTRNDHDYVVAKAAAMRAMSVLWERGYIRAALSSDREAELVDLRDALLHEQEITDQQHEGIVKMTARVKHLTALLDQQLGTPCEQIQHQEREAELLAVIKALDADINGHRIAALARSGGLMNRSDTQVKYQTVILQAHDSAIIIAAQERK